MSIVYLDTETTGLDPARHEVWEVAWAVDDGPICHGFLPHSLRYADQTALRLNGYWERYAPGRWADEGALRAALVGSTLCAANPAFDASFLAARWGSAPWSHRLLDIEAYAMGALGFELPCSLRDITRQLVKAGFTIPAPDHTAAADVDTLRSCHEALAEMYDRDRDNERKANR